VRIYHIICNTLSRSVNIACKVCCKSKRNFLPCTGSFDSAGRHSNPAVVSQFYCKSHKVDDTASLFPY